MDKQEKLDELLAKYDREEAGLYEDLSTLHLQLIADSKKLREEKGPDGDHP